MPLRLGTNDRRISFSAGLRIGIHAHGHVAGLRLGTAAAVVIARPREGLRQASAPAEHGPPCARLFDEFPAVRARAGERGGALTDRGRAPQRAVLGARVQDKLGADLPYDRYDGKGQGGHHQVDGNERREDVHQPRQAFEEKQGGDAEELPSECKTATP